MLIHPQLDPVAFTLGPLSIQWYGLMYVLAFAGFYWLARYRSLKGAINWSDEQLSDLVFYGAIGCLLYTSPSPRDATLSRMPSSA